MSLVFPAVPVLTLNFKEMKTFFITGGAGFIGYHAGIALKKSGYDVIGFDNFNDYYDPKLKKARLDQIHLTLKVLSQIVAFH